MNAQSPKKAYVKPELTAHGAMEEVTQTFRFFRRMYFGQYDCKDDGYNGGGGSFS